MKKKILMIHHSGLLVGGSLSFYNTLVELKKEYEVEVYIPNNPPDFYNFLKSKNIHPKTFSFRMGKITYYSGGNSVIHPKFWYHSLHILLQMKYWEKILIKEEPDLIIVNSKVLCWMSILANKLKIKSVCFVRETIQGKPSNMMNCIMRKMLDVFSLVVFISSYDMKQTSLKKANTMILYNFLSLSDYEDKYGKEKACDILGIPQDTFNVLFVGGINELKGVDIAIRALKYLKGEKVTLIITGKDSGYIDISAKNSIVDKVKKNKSINFSREIHRYITNEKLNNQIVNIGLQSDMGLVYSAADILILPMNKPHQARPAFEIGVQKKPVIISNFENVREFVINEYNGLNFEAGDAKSLSDAIMRLKNDPILLKNLGENNYFKTLEHHTKDKAMEKLLNEISRIFN